MGDLQIAQDTIDQARGADLLTLAGVTLRKVAGTGGGEYAGPCPICGQGRDRFRVQPEGPDGGRWYCRVCGDGKWHDSIDLVQRRNGLDFAGAVAMLTNGQAAASSLPSPTAAASPMTPTEAPGQAWQTSARAFCDEARQRLWSEAGAQALAGLRARGLSDETIQAAGLGYNDHDRRQARAAWGLPDELTKNGKPKGVWLPRGVVIPWQIGGELWRVNIRRPAEDLARDRARGIEDPSKYIGPGGFGNGLYNADGLQPGCAAVLVEGEIDALTIAQHAGGLAVAVATGSTAGSRRARWLARLALAKTVLVAYDADTPGQTAAAYWLGALPGARRWRPYWSDANQMAQDGADLRQWLAIGLGLDPGPSDPAPQVGLKVDSSWTQSDGLKANEVPPCADNAQAETSYRTIQSAEPARLFVPGAVSVGQSEGLRTRPNELGKNTSSALPKPDPHAARLVLGDFERARHRLADLEAELDAGASQLAGLPQPWPAELVDKLNGLASEADRLAPVAEYATFADLETATGAAYLAHCADKSDPALWETYRRLDNAWSTVLCLPEVHS